MEHNAVCRPLHALKKHAGLDLEIVRSSPEGYADLDGIARALRKSTRLLICNHASNVTGAINQLEPLGRLAKESGAKFMVDASQTAGVVDIDVERDGVDILAAPGHKSLLGPTGTGFCYIGPEIQIRPIVFGGTGNLSDLESMPEDLPERLEPGTLNFHGLAGLNAAVMYIQGRGLGHIQQCETEIARRTLDGLRALPGLTLHGPLSSPHRLPVFSLSCRDRSPVEWGRLLSQELGIINRVGLHCAPWAHQTIGTFPTGTLRLSAGLFHSDQDVDFLLNALARATHGYTAR
jgi:selenocysteine lyase/cysteine desulfurase